MLLHMCEFSIVTLTGFHVRQVGLFKKTEFCIMKLRLTNILATRSFLEVRLPVTRYNRKLPDTCSLYF